MTEDYGLLNILERERARFRATSLEISASSDSITLMAEWQEGNSTVGRLVYTAKRGFCSEIAKEAFARMAMAPDGTRLVAVE